MLRSPIVLILLPALVVPSIGCRQTTGPMVGGPVASGTLSPVVPGQNPVLGPFGGNTRVTPPATGSYQPTSGYTGASNGSVPGANLALTPSSVNAAAPANATAAIGSGVQVAGWTETNTVLPNAPASEPLANYGTNPSAPNPRSGGMQVIDLTAAPAPPGYQPTYQAPYQQLQVAQLPVQNIYAAPVPVMPFSTTTNSALTTQQGGRQGLDAPPSSAPTTFNPVVAASPMPNNPPTIVPIHPATTIQGPTTEPVDPSMESSNLMWRRPGSQF